MTLMKYKGPKTIELIRAQCVLRHLVCDSTLFDQGRSDYIIVIFPAAPLSKVFYKDLNGHFFGTTDQGAMFDSHGPIEFDDDPWFIALLEFFYEPLPGNVKDAERLDCAECGHWYRHALDCAVVAASKAVQS